MFTHVLGTILRLLGLLIAAFGFLGLILSFGQQWWVGAGILLVGIVIAAMGDYLYKKS